MSIYLLMLFIPPLLVVLATKLYCGSTINLEEAAVQMVAPIILVALVWNLSMYSMLTDTEILNGKVTGKEQVSVSCSHSYDCRCRWVTSGSGKRRHRYRRCDTCYEHLNDWDWRVYTTVGNFEVDREDRRGYYPPKRWSIVMQGQPAAKEHNYTNYIRSAPDSILHITNATLYKGSLPKYPSLYDYQHVNHVMSVGAKVPDLKDWNDLVALSLNDLGVRRQVNTNIVFTSASPIFADALRREWLGGKKNDVTIVIGTQYPTIRWVRVFSWAKHDIVNVAIRSDLLESKTLSPVVTVGIISRNVARYYERRPMADFEYLATEATPPLWVMIIALLFGTGLAIFLGYEFHRNEYSSSFRSPKKHQLRF